MVRHQCLGILILVALLGLTSSTQAQLKMGFYTKSCPQAEKIVQDFVKEHIPNAPSLAAALIRMHFHDCFVRGCDASILLNSTANNRSEKEAIPNQTVRGFNFIDRIKALLEKACPGVVSCADIITLATRDAIVVTGGPFWRVPTGRRDGRVSIQQEALNNIPAPFHNFTTMQRLFANQSLDVKDLVLTQLEFLTAHLSQTVYTFTGRGDEDPALDSEYAANLRANKCRTPNDNTTKVEMDPGSRKTFDLSYYTLLLKRRGLFESDAALTTNSDSLTLINQLLQRGNPKFFAEFAKSMEKMGRINVRTGSDGEIRRHCAVVN